MQGMVYRTAGRGLSGGKQADTQSADYQDKENNDLNKEIAKKSVPAKEQIDVNKEPRMLRR